MKSIWKDEMILDAYRLARQGLVETEISKILGVSTPTLRLWKTKKKAFFYALKEGRKEYWGKGKKAITLQNHIFNRLPPDVRKAWKKINRIQKEKQGHGKLEAYLEKKGKYIRQHLFLYAWTSSNFNIVAACRKVNIPRVTVDQWRKTDTGFGQIVLEVERYKKDFFENHLINLVAGGSESATLFVNKTYNSDRYQDPKKQIDVNLSGSVNVNVTCLADLNLGPKTRKTLLKAIREYKKTISQEKQIDES